MENTFTPRDIIAALRESDGMISITAKTLGFTCQALRDYISSFEEVQQVCHDIEEASLDLAEGLLLDFCRGEVNGKEVGETVQLDAIMFYLETQGKERGYCRRIEHIHSGDEQLTE